MTAERMKPWLLAAAMTALYALAVVLCFWKVLGPDVVFVAPDAPVTAASLAEAWGSFLRVPTLQGLVSLLPHRFAYEGTFWVDGYVMCLAAVFLLRGRGSTWGAAWVGGLCAAFVGYFFTLFCAGHRGVVDALAVTCLCFGALLRGVRTGRLRWWAALGAFAALGLGAQADVWLLAVCALAAYGVWLPAVERPAWKPLALGVAVTAVVFGALAWPALRHTFAEAQTTRQTQLRQAEDAAQAGGTGEDAADARWAFVTGWSLPPEDLAELIVPGIHGHTSYPFDPEPYTGRMGTERFALRQHSVHVGWVALALAALAALRRREPEARDLWFWWGLAAVALVLALGRYTPVYRAVAALPLLGEIRAPAKWFHLTGFALAVLAGIGAESVVRRFGAKAALALGAAAALCGALVARPYVFPRDLSHNALTAAVPPGATLCPTLPWADFIDVCRWQGIPLSDGPARADVLAAVAQPWPKPPLATMASAAIPVATCRLMGAPTPFADTRLRVAALLVAVPGRAQPFQARLLLTAGEAARLAQAVDPADGTFHALWESGGAPDAQTGLVDLQALVWRPGAEAATPLRCRTLPDQARLLPHLRATGPTVPLALLPKP